MEHFVTQYVYRTDTLETLLGHSGDPWLRARRFRDHVSGVCHWQLEGALEGAGESSGVFRLSAWRSVKAALPDLHAASAFNALAHDESERRALVLQRIRADHPFLGRYQRGDDEYLGGKAWLFWNTRACRPEQAWSTDGIHHSDIEVFHPDGTWVPYEKVIPSTYAPPAPLPGWLRLSLDAGSDTQPPRAVDATWLDHPTLGRCFFARVPVWSRAMYSEFHHRVIGNALLAASPSLLDGGRLMLALERPRYTLAYELVLAREPARQAPTLTRWLRRDKDRSGSVAIERIDLLSRGDGLVESLYRAAGIALTQRGAAERGYGPEALAILEAEAIAESDATPAWEDDSTAVLIAPTVDALIGQVIAACNEAQLLAAVRGTFAEAAFQRGMLSEEVRRWRHCAQQSPATEISASRNHSIKGMATCGLLRLLEVEQPDAARTRREIAWAILDSAEGQRIVGHRDDLERARDAHRMHYAQSVFP